MMSQCCVGNSCWCGSAEGHCFLSSRRAGEGGDGAAFAVEAAEITLNISDQRLGGDQDHVMTAVIAGYFFEDVSGICIVGHDLYYAPSSAERSSKRDGEGL